MDSSASIGLKKRTHPVVVYGATGYTGQLTCEALARQRVPFTASGRNRVALQALVDDLQGHGAQCNAEVIQHSAGELSSLLHEASVVINLVGPHAKLGTRVVEAALEAGCHYVDSAAEPDFLMDVRDRLGEPFRRKRLVLAPSIALMWGLGHLATDLCLRAGAQELELFYAPPSLQTVACLRSLWQETLREQFSMRHATFGPSEFGLVNRVLPSGAATTAIRIASGPSSFLVDDPRVNNFEGYLASNLLLQAAPLFQFWRELHHRVIDNTTLNIWSDALVEKLKCASAPDEADCGRFAVAATGSGTNGSVQVAIHGRSPYLNTGFLLAATAQALVETRQHHSGYVSLSQGFGSCYMLKRLEEIGTYAEITGQDLPAPTANQVRPYRGASESRRGA